MPRSELVVALDIGTTKVCTLVGEVSGDDQVAILGVGMARSTGMRKGVVVDIAATAAAIRESVAEAERNARADIGTVYVGITGAHITSQTGLGVVQINHEVQEEDVQQALHNARQVVLPPDREIVHNIPRQFIVDGQEGVRHPVGMSAVRLEAQTHIVTAGSSFVANVVKCVQRARLEIEELVVEPYATGLAILTDAERQLGVALADIGGGTTDVALFVDGAVTHTTVIPIGGNHVTNDLALLLRLAPEDAERIKLAHGAARKADIQADEYVEIRMIGESEPREVPRGLLTEISEPRMEELFQLVGAHLAQAARDGVHVSSCVLSGGGSQLSGSTELAQQTLHLPVRSGRPREVIDPGRLVDSPIYATAVGMLHYAAQRLSSRRRVREPRSITAAAFRLLFGWLPKPRPRR